METLRKSLRIPLFASLCLAPAPVLAHAYSARATQGRIVDAETRAPVEGAVVVAHWALEYGLEGGMRHSWVVLETATDASGHFAFPAWGPKEVPASLPWSARLKARDPEVVFFKDGYAGVKQTQSQADKAHARPREFPGRGASMREWHLNGETFLYRSAAGDPTRAAEEARAFDLFLGALRGSPCLYLQISRALADLRAARARLATEAPQTNPMFRYGTPAYEQWTPGGAATESGQRAQCGTSAREALERTGG